MHLLAGMLVSFATGKASSQQRLRVQALCAGTVLYSVQGPLMEGQIVRNPA